MSEDRLGNMLSRFFKSIKSNVSTKSPNFQQKIEPSICIKNIVSSQSTLYTNTDIYCDGKLLSITIDLKPYLAKIRVMLDKKKNR